jgi:hypothetical protein
VPGLSLVLVYIVEVCMCSILFISMARLSTYASVFVAFGELLNLYPMCPFSSHQSRAFRNMISMYGLSSSP